MAKVPLSIFIGESARNRKSYWEVLFSQSRGGFTGSASIGRRPIPVILGVDAPKLPIDRSVFPILDELSAASQRER